MVKAEAPGKPERIEREDLLEMIVAVETVQRLEAQAEVCVLRLEAVQRDKLAAVAKQNEIAKKLREKYELEGTAKFDRETGIIER